MRLVKTILMVALAVVWFMVAMSGVLLGQAAAPAKKQPAGPALLEPPPKDVLGPGDVIVQKQGKVYKGWITDKGKVGISNDYGRVIFTGLVDRMGGAEMQDVNTGEMYTGRVNPAGEGRLFDLETGDSLHIEIHR